MDIFKLTKSKTRQNILTVFLENPEKEFYLHELARSLAISAGNIRRELLAMTKSGLFTKSKKEKRVYYRINISSPLFQILSSLNKTPNQNIKHDISSTGKSWIESIKAPQISDDLYCQTRDVFQSRLQTLQTHLEKNIGTDSYLLTAVIGEIGNNSFDHNLGNWPDIPGIYFAVDQKIKTIILADRGQGILKTIRNIRPNTTSDRDALEIAFTEVISGRLGQHRGNGLKFVAKIIGEKKWRLDFSSGNTVMSIGQNQKMVFSHNPKSVRGCFAIIKY